MSTAPTKARRWEKPPVASSSSTSSTSSTSATSAVPTPSSQISSFIEGLSDVERASHRAAFLHLLQSMTGNNVAVECTDGVKVTGVFHASTPFERKPHVVIVKGSRYLQADASAVANGANDGKTAVVEFSKVFNYQTTNKLDLVSRNYSSEFQTDTAIKKHGDMSYLSGRNLQSLDSSWLEPSGDMSLEGKTNSGKTWDQFEANKRLFNVKDTYDENLYTKRLDLKSMTAEQIAQADRMAREIEGTLSSNIHLQEERGHVMEGEWDEEDRYSGVLRSTAEGSGSGKGGSATAGTAPNAWKRGIRLGGSAATSGAPSPATTTPGGGASVASAKAGTPKTVSPPPGVPMPTAGQATNSPSPKKTSTATATTTTAAVAENEKVKSKPPSPVPATGDSTPVKPVAVKVETTTKPTTTAATTTTTTVASVGIASTTPPPAEEKTTTTVTAPAPTTSTTTVAEVTADAAAKATAAKKLSAKAAEFKPSWMKDPTPAPATAEGAPVPPPVSSPTPAVPMMNVPAVPTFVPQYPNVPYGIPMSPEGTIPGQGMYQNKVHSSPGGQAMAASPNMQPMMEMPPPYFDPQHMGGMALPPQQGYMPQQMYMPEGHLPPPQFMQMPMGGMPMQMPMGMPGMPMEYGMHMPNGMMMMPQGQPEFYPQQMMGMPAPMMSPGQQHMQGGYGGYPGGSPGYGQHMQGGFNPNMGSGQKMGYDKMRGPGGHKGGRGMKPHYNSGGGRGGGGYIGNHMNNNNTGSSHMVAGNSPGTPMATGPTRSRGESVGETSP